MGKGLSNDTVSIIILLIFNGCLLTGLITYYMRQKKWSTAEPDDFGLKIIDPVAIGEGRKPGQSSDYSIMMNRYGFKPGTEAAKKSNTTNLYEALIDDSVAAHEMDSRMAGQGVQGIGDFSAIGNTLLNETRNGRRFGIG